MFINNINLIIPMDEKKGNWKLIGNVAVDSGTLMISDPCYIIGDKWSEEHYDGDVCSMNGLSKQLKKPWSVLFQSGFGDGVYEVWANILEFKGVLGGGKRITEVRIKLIDDDELKEIVEEQEVDE